jgi:uncharacterized protein DUF4255/carboxypeptidase family protein
MFHDLDTTIEKILNDTAAPAELQNAGVSFETPINTYSPKLPDRAIDLFLYEVKENRELRDPVPISETVNNVYVLRRPPVRVDCSYLVTAWTDGLTGWTKIQTEHQLLGQAFFWLSRFPTIPSTYFAGSLVGQPFPPPSMVAQWDAAKNQGEFWNALGIPPRPYFNLIVTIAMDLGVQAPDGPQVVTKEFRFKQILETADAGLTQGMETEITFEIAGVVRDAANQSPIPKAQVNILSTGRFSNTNDAGQFRFSGLKAGNYTLRTSANGYSTGDKPIVVPGTVLNSYDVALN